MTLPIEAKANHWEPVEWHPYYEQIVLESCCGVTNIELARKYGLSKVHVSNILRTKSAQEVRNRVLADIQAGSKVSIQDKLAQMTEKSIERVAAMLDNDKLFAEKPLAVADRAFRMLEGMNKLKPKGDVVVNNNITNVSDAVIDRFTEALKASNAAKAYHTIEDKEDDSGTNGVDGASKLLRETNSANVEVGVRPEYRVTVRQAV